MYLKQFYLFRKVMQVELCATKVKHIYKHINYDIDTINKICGLTQLDKHIQGNTLF